MIQLEVTGMSELKAKFTAFPTRLRQALTREMTMLSIMLESYIKKEKLSGQVLHVVSGNLRDSVSHEVVSEMDRIQARVFSGGNIPYAAIHEYGGKTSPHDIFPKTAQALFFQIGGQEIFAKVVHHPGSVMPERSYMRSSLEDMRAAIFDGMKEAAAEAWQ